MERNVLPFSTGFIFSFSPRQPLALSARQQGDKDRWKTCIYTVLFYHDGFCVVTHSLTRTLRQQPCMFHKGLHTHTHTRGVRTHTSSSTVPHVQVSAETHSVCSCFLLSRPCCHGYRAGPPRRFLSLSLPLPLSFFLSLSLSFSLASLSPPLGDSTHQLDCVIS